MKCVSLILLLAVLCAAWMVSCGGEGASVDTTDTVAAETVAEQATQAIETTPEAILTEQVTEIPTEAVTEQESETATEAVTESATEAQTQEGSQMKVNYETIQNPVCPAGADPWVIEHDGYYYYCYSLGIGVGVKKMSSLTEIASDGAWVYLAPQDSAYSSEYWAPELHYINGEWYIYVAADDGNNDNHRMYVLKGTSQDPTQPFEMVGVITDSTNKWAIDGTVLTLNGELYFVWSGWEGDVNVAQNIYIAHMSNPWTIDSERVLLSSPTYLWERVGNPYVNEGPAALTHDGKSFIVYSASGSWTDNYCLGMLTLTGDDPLNPDHWEKSETPVFKQRKHVAYGPGHCSFTTACDGSVWMVYHANLVSGTGWDGRSVWLAPVTFDANGKPKFGQPSKRVSFPVSVTDPEAETQS